MKRIALLALLALCMTACVSIPEKATAVKDFKQDKFLGTWYEIARFDFKYEKDMDLVTAQYTLREDGKIRVDNKGYNVVKKEWQQKIGKAKSVGSDTDGRLKVSFFGPFYSGYNVVSIDEDYNYVLVMGNDLDYIWFLSRTKDMPEAIKTKYKKMAEEVGYDLSRLRWTDQKMKP